MRRTLVGVFVLSLLLADAGSALASVERLDRCRSAYFICDVPGRYATSLLFGSPARWG